MPDGAVPEGTRPADPVDSEAGGSASATAGTRGGAEVLVTTPLRSRLRPSGLTTRALALAVVLLVLTISYASSLRIYFEQEAEIAASRTEIATRQAKIAELQSDLARWQDPAYVALQARTRLGWVLPGERGYRVVTADGQPVGGTTLLPTPADAEPQPPWYAKLWGSVEAADRPR